MLLRNSRLTTDNGRVGGNETGRAGRSGINGRGSERIHSGGGERVNRGSSAQGINRETAERRDRGDADGPANALSTNTSGAHGDDSCNAC